jgi:hypothetical protein
MKRRLLRRKNGSGLFDGLFVFLFAIGLFIIMGFSLFILDQFVGEYQELDAAPDYMKEDLANYSTQSNFLMDSLVVFLIFGSWVVALVINYFLDNSNVFFIAFMVLNLFFLIPLFPVSNFVSSLLAEEGTMSWIASTLPMSTFVLTNIAIFYLGYIASIGLVLYIKGRVRE